MPPRHPLDGNNNANEENVHRPVAPQLSFKNIFAFGSIVLLVCSAYTLWGINATVEKRMLERPDYPHPQWADFSMLLYVLAVFIPVRILTTKFLFSPLGDRVLPLVHQKKEWTEEIRRDRVNRFGAVCFKFVYFFLVTPLGYLILKDTNYLPTTLGGKAENALNVWEGYPFPPPVPYLKEYYMIGLGYHTQSLIFHVLSSRRSDFMEMLLHHVCSNLLIVFSYMDNFVRVGSLVLIVHDLADIFAYLVKIFVDTKNTVITLTAYASLLFVWAYSRFYVFVFQIILSIHDTSIDKRPNLYDWHYLTAMLYVLVAMHLYWYCLFLYMGFVYANTGKTRDVQQQTLVKQQAQEHIKAQ